MYDLTGKIAVITGAGGEHGIGHAIAVRLAQEGADIIVNDLTRNPKNSSSWTGLTDVVKEIQTLGRRALGIEADISDSSQVTSLVQRTIQEFGKIDFLVNSAAVDAKFDKDSATSGYSKFTEFPEKNWSQSKIIGRSKNSRK